MLENLNGGTDSSYSLHKQLQVGFVYERPKGNIVHCVLTWETLGFSGYFWNYG